MNEERKKRGPKPTYEKRSANERGAPRLISRVDPDVLEWATSRPEGTRQYLERLIRADRDSNAGK